MSWPNKLQEIESLPPCRAPLKYPIVIALEFKHPRKADLVKRVEGDLSISRLRHASTSRGPRGRFWDRAPG